MDPGVKIKPLKLMVSGRERVFDIDQPTLPDWVEKHALGSGGFPYDFKLKQDEYEKELNKLQVEFIKVQSWLMNSKERLMVLFEGRDAAGKDGAIKAIHQNLNPRSARAVALTKPTDAEMGQWYFQRYITHFPTAGEFVLFNRSWYNRAGVEPVMGFCTDKQYKAFLKAVPLFEDMIINEGILFFKFWLNIGQEMQMERFHDRRHDPLKTWKLSLMDMAALEQWDNYTEKRDRMFDRTHTRSAPWTVVRANDKRRARLNLMRHLLHELDYDGKDKAAIGDIDPSILGNGPDFLR